MDLPREESGGQEDLVTRLELVIDGKQSPLRIDKFLLHRLEHTSRTRIQAAVEAGCLRVNGQVVRSSYRVRPGDEVALIMPVTRHQTEVVPEPMDLDIVHEDDHLLVVDKTPGIVVHPGVGNPSGTLINGILHHVGGADLPGDAERPGLVHRIDKDTSGLLVVAKSETAAQGLARQFFEHTVERSYLALVWGDLTDTFGTVDAPIARHPRYRQRFAVPQDEGVGKHAVTHYEVEEELGYVTLVRCRLETGRTHQIRVHMQHIGHPLFQDSLYGGDRIVKGTLHKRYQQFIKNCFDAMPRQALHAASLGFVHPASGEDMSFQSPLPNDFAQVVERWRNYYAQLRR